MSTCEFATFTISDQLYGLSVTDIHDVFRPTNMRQVPLLRHEIGVVLYLRGRIVIVIDARSLFGLPPRENINNSGSCDRRRARRREFRADDRRHRRRRSP